MKELESKSFAALVQLHNNIEALIREASQKADEARDLIEVIKNVAIRATAEVINKEVFAHLAELWKGEYEE